MPTRRTRSGPSARAANANVAAPPNAAMNSRRLMGLPRAIVVIGSHHSRLWQGRHATSSRSIILSGERRQDASFLVFLARPSRAARPEVAVSVGTYLL